MRLFVAINFSDSVRQRLNELVENLKVNSFRGRFTDAANLHLTLAFLGECSGEELAAAQTVVRGLDFSSFKLTIDSLGRFKRRSGDIWWAGVRESEILRNLQAELKARLVQAGFAFDDQEFTAHITLGRGVLTTTAFAEAFAVDFAEAFAVARETTPDSLAGEPFQPFSETVTRIDLMRSESIQGKMVYTAVG